VRSLCVLLLAAFTVLDSVTPLHAALGDASRCLLPPGVPGAPDLAGVNPAIPVLKPGLADYDSEERDYLIRTMVFEASGEPEEGKAAVAHVILNRKRLGMWGDNIKEVVTRPWQFEPWMTKRSEIESLSKNDPRYRRAARIVDDVLSGQEPDPTAGATHFLNPTIVRKRRGGSLPNWARGEGQPIGRHTFYSPEANRAVPLEAILLADASPNAPSIAPGEGEDTDSAPFHGGCRKDGITATSPALPAQNAVQIVGR
jgi:cell wall hydrolase